MNKKEFTEKWNKIKEYFDTPQIAIYKLNSGDIEIKVWPDDLEFGCFRDWSIEKPQIVKELCKEFEQLEESIIFRLESQGIPHLKNGFVFTGIYEDDEFWDYFSIHKDSMNAWKDYQSNEKEEIIELNGKKYKLIEG